MAAVRTWWWSARAYRGVPEAVDMLRVGGLLVEASNFSDMGEIRINPHRHLCAKNVRILGVEKSRRLMGRACDRWCVTCGTLRWDSL